MNELNECKKRLAQLRCLAVYGSNFIRECTHESVKMYEAKEISMERNERKVVSSLKSYVSETM